MITRGTSARVCLYVMAGWAAALGIGWAVLKARNPQIAERDQRDFEKVG